MDEFSRYAVRVSVAQICQAVGWTKIQSTPLEVLTDFMQEYILSIGRLANNYATLLGHSEPNLSHVSLAFKDMNISFSELKDYITHFESGAALEVPKYPIHKESHLNHLKPGSREVLTRPVHIHDHLPPMFPELEGQVSLIYRSPTYDNLPSDRLSPTTELKIKPEPSDSFYDEWNESPHGEDIRPLRELSSVLMTTSGFLSSAREGKLPEVRNLTPALPEIDESKVLLEPGKAKDKENRFKEEHATEKVHVPPERKSKHKKHKKKSLHRDNPISKPTHKIDEDIFFINPKQTSGSIKKVIKNDHNMGTFKKDMKLSSKIHSSSKQISSISSNPNNLSHKDYKDLKEYRNHLKHQPLEDTKDNNLSLIDLFSVPQINGNEKSNYNTDNIIDVVNSSPINSFDYSNHSSPLLELDDPSFIPQGNASSPFFHFDQKSPEFVSEKNNFEVKTENRTSEVTVHCTSPDFKCDNETPSFKQERSSPVFKHDFLSPGVRFESPTFDFEREGSVFDHERPSPKEKTHETILDHKNDSPVSGIPPHDINTLLNPSSSFHSKKKKKKEKKNKSKDKNIDFVEEVTKAKLKVKKKKKDSKKDKNIVIDNKCLLGTNMDGPTPLKKVKLEIGNFQKETKDKQCASNNLPFPSPEICSIPRINESQYSIPASHLSSSISETSEPGSVGRSLGSAGAGVHSSAPAKHTTGSESASHLSTSAGDSACPRIHSSPPVSSVNVCHSSAPAGTASHTSTPVSSATQQTHQVPHRKTKNEERKKEKKEKRREKESMKHLSEDLFTFEPLKRVKEKDKRKSASPLPKITFKLGPSPPKINPEPKHQKIIIKPVVKNEKHTIDSSNKHQQQNPPSNASSHQADGRVLPQPAGQTSGYEGHSGGYSAPLVQQPPVMYDPNQIWICPACNRPDDGSPMIACDKCDLWFHWVCVGIFEAIEGDWYCKTCLVKKEQDKIRDKKKKQKKKKNVK